MKKSYLNLGVLLAAIVLMGAGCVRFSGTGGGVADGGVFRSADAGKSWTQKVAIPDINGNIKGFQNVDILKLVQDPQDNNTLYAATLQSGILYTYDKGERWMQVPAFINTTVRDVAVDYDNKCTLFAAVGNKIYKSTDCSRSWNQVYFDTRADVEITDVETEWFNKNVVYAGNNKGDILKSGDFGNSWQTIKRIDGPVTKIYIDRNDTRILYVGSSTRGLFKTSDGGKTWSDDSKDTDINQALREFSRSNQFKAIAQDINNRNNLIMASTYGLLRTKDGGQTWEEIRLITPAGGATITSLAIDPKNGNNVYYGTNTTLYKSVDSGATWNAQKLPTTRQANVLLIDQVDPRILYMGTLRPQK